MNLGVVYAFIAVLYRPLLRHEYEAKSLNAALQELLLVAGRWPVERYLIMRNGKYLQVQVCHSRSNKFLELGACISDRKLGPNYFLSVLVNNAIICLVLRETR